MKIKTYSIQPLSDEQKQRLRYLGEASFFDSEDIEIQEFLAQAHDAEILLLTNRLGGYDPLEYTHKCKLISLTATGYEVIDVKKASSMGIAVTNVPEYSAASVSEHVFAMILAFERKIINAHKSVRDGNFDFVPFQGNELHSKTMGIIGLGNIGKTVAQMSKAFGMNVIVNTRTSNNEYTNVDLDTLLAKSDYVSIHLPSTKETRNFISAGQFETMKKSAILINTSRGQVVDETALIQSLSDRRIRGACLDVLNPEPPKKDNPLFKMDNVLITPHCAFNTKEASRRLNDIAIDNIEAYINGKPQNLLEN
ncbi:glycerate dehydrogenase [Candidatus Woesearchaeota archaeon]|nr:glycerate dehydrogenase [Candidatus Woesearchaeota archaeon]